MKMMERGREATIREVDSGDDEEESYMLNSSLHANHGGGVFTATSSPSLSSTGLHPEEEAAPRRPLFRSMLTLSKRYSRPAPPLGRLKSFRRRR